MEITKAGEVTRNEIQHERDEWFRHLKNWNDHSTQQQLMLNSMVEKFELILQTVNQESRKNDLNREKIQTENLNLIQHISTDKKFSEEYVQLRNTDVAQRAELLHQLKMSHLEHQEKFEQLLSVLSTQLEKLSSIKSA